MTEQTAYERATTEFPNPITFSEVQALFLHLHTQEDYEIRYATETAIRLVKGEAPSKEVTSIKGHMGERPNIPADFALERVIDGDDSKFSKIRFNTIPGYDLSEHREGEVETWNNTRRAIEEYFST